jgi:hypothetical protein
MSREHFHPADQCLYDFWRKSNSTSCWSTLVHAVQLPGSDGDERHPAAAFFGTSVLKLLACWTAQQDAELVSNAHGALGGHAANSKHHRQETNLYLDLSTKLRQIVLDFINLIITTKFDSE